MCGWNARRARREAFSTNRGVQGTMHRVHRRGVRLESMCARLARVSWKGCRRSCALRRGRDVSGMLRVRRRTRLQLLLGDVPRHPLGSQARMRCRQRHHRCRHGRSRRRVHSRAANDDVVRARRAARCVAGSRKCALVRLHVRSFADGRGLLRGLIHSGSAVHHFRMRHPTNAKTSARPPMLRPIPRFIRCGQ